MPEIHLPPPIEQERIPVNSVDALRSMRFENATVQTDIDMLRTIDNLDKITNPNSMLQRLRDVDLGSDIGALGVDHLLAFDALGLPPEKLVAITGRNSGPQDEVIAKLTADDESLQLKRYSEGVSLTFDKAGHEPNFSNPINPTIITDKIRERYAVSPAHQAIHELASNGVYSEGVISSEDFDPYTDPLGTLSLLVSMEIVDYNSSVRRLRDGDKPYEILVTSISEVPEYSRAHREDHGEVTTWSIGKSIVSRISMDHATRKMNMSFEKHPEAVYPEISNQAPDSIEVPFIETEAAKEMYQLLDDAGLMLNPEYEAEVVRIGEAKRFGSVYSQMSREIAKWVDRPERTRVSNIFIPFDPTLRETLRNERFSGEAESEFRSKLYELSKIEVAEREASITAKLKGLNIEGMSEPTRVLFGIVQEVINRTANTTDSELPVTLSEVKIEGGSCFDVTTYYVGSAAYYGKTSRTPKLRQIKPHGVPMLEKTHGNHTFMLLKPTKFNGVNLPKGTLMQQGDDNGWAMLRLTPFCFDNPIDRQATGSEMAKTISHEQEAIGRIGGLALHNVANYASPHEG